MGAARCCRLAVRLQVCLAILRFHSACLCSERKREKEKARKRERERREEREREREREENTHPGRQKTKKADS